MSKENEKGDASKTRGQILSERDALRGMLDLEKQQRADLLNDKRALFALTNIIGMVGKLDIGVLKRAIDVLTTIGMGPQLAAADAVLKQTLSCGCDVCRYVMGEEVADIVAQPVIEIPSEVQRVLH